ncbi:helix-turn-helix domain-containing protein [Marinibaculum pumilum]|uniref:Helix-turn-helix domain-containing protein n=1 Tax=Marinibaculum pumilum TaxID=1766165 RepID=A0ABV7L2Q8_9PROT
MDAHADSGIQADGLHADGLHADGAISVRDTDRFDYWHDWICRHYSVTDCRRLNDESFESRASNWRCGPLALGEVELSGHGAMRWTRRPDEIRCDPRDHYQFLLVLHGRVTIAQEDRAAALQPGDLMYYHQGRPFDLAAHGDTRSLLVSVPWPAVYERLPGADRLTACRLSGGTPYVRLAAAVLRELLAAAPAGGSAALDRIGTSAVDILVAAIEGDRQRDAGEDDILARAKRYMRENLHDPDLHVEDVAAALGMSRRTLNRLFVAEGTTPMRWLWQQRLSASYRALSEGRARQVTEAAFGAGFSDLSHFSRAFRQAFGRAPSSLKRR